MVDYSKWKNIEVSDDEDDTHPNIDTPSLFRWRHKARLERMEEMENLREELKRRRQTHTARMIDVKEKMKTEADNLENLKKELAKLESEGKKLDKEEEEFRKTEKKTPWNVDTISKPGFEKTVINKKAPRKEDENLTEEEREEQMKIFIKDNEKLLKQYGMLRKYDDSKRFLQQHMHLVCENTANYLVIWSINLEMEGKHELMAHVAHQCICMQYVMELGKQLDIDPRACVSSFFSKIQKCDPEYKAHFDDEIDAFKKRIEKRAQEKIQEALAEEEAERESRLGPGGLDPADVFEELPDELKECFESRDVKKLQDTIAKMPVDVAQYHMKRCVDSGLWVPNAKTDGEKDVAERDEDHVDEQAKEPEKEETKYSGVCSKDLD